MYTVHEHARTYLHKHDDTFFLYDASLRYIDMGQNKNGTNW